MIITGFIRSGKVRKESMLLRVVRTSHEMSGNFVDPSRKSGTSQEILSVK